MSRDIFPIYSKTKVENAGKNIRKGIFTEEDIKIIENWRISHNHILNSWQAILRNRCKGKNIIFAQRLKRKNTILDKLSRENEMNLARMHDIAGCRLIFENIEELYKFREDLHKSRFKHEKRHSNTRYDYISCPKEDGYRGVHDVFSYKSSRNHKKHWDGLLIEIQYRTLQQHAWATAVELAGSITGNNIKFKKASDEFVEYFKLSSEIIARTSENRSSCLSELTNKDIIEKFAQLEGKLNLIRTFQSLRRAQDFKLTEAKNFIISVDFSKVNFKDSFSKIEMSQLNSIKLFEYENFKTATMKYFEFEKTNPNLDIVLVRSDRFSSIRDTYNNYFLNPTVFIKLIRQGIKKLESSIN